MIKQSFLDTLKGLPLDVAEEACHKLGYETNKVPEGVAITLIARPNTIILWHKKNVVTGTMPGDGLELEEDEWESCGIELSVTSKDIHIHGLLAVTVADHLKWSSLGTNMA